MRLVLSSVLLGLVWFVASNAIASLLAWMIGRSALKKEAMIGAARLLTLRLAPAVSSLIFTLFVFLPAHLTFEPEESDERFGVILGLMASVGLAMLVAAACRAGTAYVAGRRFAVLVEQAGHPNGTDVLEVRGFSGVSLAGIWRPRILIGAEARAALTPAELDLAVSHENAHRQSLDNLKRFLILAAPDLFGWTAVARDLEARWQAEAECEADACAVGGDGHRAALLASALVKVARLACGATIRPVSPAWSSFHAPTLLELRVRQLVSGPFRQPVSTRTIAWSTLTLTLGIPVSLWLVEFSHTLHVATEAMVTHLP